MKHLKPALFVLFLTAFSVVAQEATPEAKPNSFMGTLVQLPVFIGLFALFYFGMIRPQRQQQKKHTEFVAALAKGDEVVLSSGFIGRVVGLTDRVAAVEIAPGVEVKVLKTQVQSKAAEVISPTA